MSTSPLLALALVLLGCAAAAAQSSPGASSASQPLPALFVPQAKADFDFAFPSGSRPHAADPGQASPNQSDRTCYSIRSYRVTRNHPDSDSTRPAAYSTCQPASRFQVKETGDAPEIVPR
jgi:hypothetical protein